MILHPVRPELVVFKHLGSYTVHMQLAMKAVRRCDTSAISSLPKTLPRVDYCAFFACPRKPGAVLLDFSRSAAHSAAPTVLVKAKARLANGTISSKNATTPNL